MALPLQLFGTIETANETSDAMMCMDKDRPDEAMLHWWGKDTVTTAALVKIQRNDDKKMEFMPFNVYHANESGGLFLPPRNDSDLEYIRDFHCEVQEIGQGLQGEWSHTSNKKGSIILKPAPTVHAVEAKKCATWNEFKDWANFARNEGNVAVFRGHGSNNFRLKTTLHRAGKTRIEKYCSETLVEFQGHAEAILGMRLNMADPMDYSMLLGLAQHHGLPTPLLDWTTSPYIAAFFAFADAFDASSVRRDDTHVRIYGLTKKFRTATANPIITLPYFRPYACFLSISARNNPRLYAQQGHFLVTNMDDVENYLCSLEKKSNEKILIAADVPIACANEALEDLAYMGLTAATMFPRLDGVCRMMKHAMSFNQRSMPTAGKPIATTPEKTPAAEKSNTTKIGANDPATRIPAPDGHNPTV
jgi:hypothetical protein